MGESVNAMTDSDGTENPHKTKQPSSAGSVGSSGGSKPLEEEVAHDLGVEADLYTQPDRDNQGFGRSSFAAGRRPMPSTEELLLEDDRMLRDLLMAAIAASEHIEMIRRGDQHTFQVGFGSSEWLSTAIRMDDVGPRHQGR